MRKFDAEEVKSLINRHSMATKIYFGCDSYRFKKEGVWYARYTTVTVIHKDGKHGCAVFGDIVTERDFDQKKDKPIQRMMSEVYKMTDMYNEIADAIGDRCVELHCDINIDPEHGSNVAYKPALGYVQAMTGIKPTMKPGALAASFCADHFRTYSEAA